MDPLKVMAELRSRHICNENTTGINLQRLEVGNMLELKVWEPLMNKKSQIVMATEAAVSILKIDKVVMFQQLKLRTRLKLNEETSIG